MGARVWVDPRSHRVVEGHELAVDGPYRIVRHHILRNAAIPIVTVIGWRIRTVIEVPAASFSRRSPAAHTGAYARAVQSPTPSASSPVAR